MVKQLYPVLSHDVLTKSPVNGQNLHSKLFFMTPILFIYIFSALFSSPTFLQLPSSNVFRHRFLNAIMVVVASVWLNKVKCISSASAVTVAPLDSFFLLFFQSNGANV